MEKIIVDETEEFNYFISYIADDIYCNDEIKYAYINSLDDIHNIEHTLWQKHNKECIVISYRMF